MDGQVKQHRLPRQPAGNQRVDLCAMTNYALDGPLSQVLFVFTNETLHACVGGAHEL
jgi:hypothetical protein